MGLKEWLKGEPDPKKSYQVKVICTNCDRVITVRIGHGWSVEGWSKNAKCANCKRKGSFQKYRQY
ncbi:hypothetical protein NKOR_03875 [Candidatus Nitrosopumilus koreensis AR1]|uniref:Uncharacterized protein n=1 Tax=Candidatus Nitrosopumilus koreensis AR1 TaxID=1229908 RepID=K0B6R7_9ARCH|nr:MULTISPECIES: hypothetical protein [Nitrosopumilus]AFS80665.1 hypothetical protein NKOR_03875 [Candidatus Nitrosopumilus koreensis AR1]